MYDSAMVPSKQVMALNASGLGRERHCMVDPGACSCSTAVYALLKCLTWIWDDPAFLSWCELQCRKPATALVT